MKVPSHLPRELRSDRLRLSPWRSGDAAVLVAAFARSESHLRPFVPFQERSVPATEAWLASLAGDDRAQRYALWLGDVLVGELLAIARPEPGVLEVGYWIGVDHVRQGLATEAVRTLLTVTPEVERYLFRVAAANAASVALVRRLGAIRDGQETEQGAVLGLYWLARP